MSIQLKPCVYQVNIAFFAPGDESPCKVMLFKGEALFSVVPQLIVKTLLHANGDTDATHELFTSLNMATPNDPRPIIGIQSMPFFRLSEEQVKQVLQLH